MQFERGQDIKKSLNIGIRNPKYVHAIFIVVRDPSIVDNRPISERRFRPDPRMIWKAKIFGKEVHEVLHLLKNNMKFPLEYFFEKYPDIEHYVKDGHFQFGFHILLEKEKEHDRGFPSISLREIVGKYLIYEDKVYFMKEKRP